MYKIVETKEERWLFNKIFKEAYSEKNYGEDEHRDLLKESYLVKNNEGEFAGTLEFILFNGKNSTFNNPELFAAQKIVEQARNVWELDKVCVRETDRKKGTLDHIIQAIYEIANKKDIDYVVAEMNPLFCRALKIEYKLDVIRIGSIVKIEYPYIPVIISVSATNEEYEQWRKRWHNKKC